MQQRQQVKRAAKSGHLKAIEADARRSERKAARQSARAAGKIARRFAVMRVRKYKSMGSIANLSRHNLRNGKRLPHNADPSRQSSNQFRIFRAGCTTLDEAVKSRLAEAGIKPRSNAVQLLEFVFTFSPEAQPKSLSAWAADSLAWARKEFGKNNLIAAEVHMDEATPHIHCQVVPIITKARKVRGKDEYHAPEERLDARTLIGGDDGAKKLSRLQTSYAEAVGKHGLERGVMKSGGHHPRHNDVRVRRGEVMRKKGLLDIHDRLDKAEDRRLKAESALDITQGRYVHLNKLFKDKDAELEAERKRLTEEIKRQDKMRLEAIKQRDELQAKLIRLNPALAEHAKPSLKMKVMPGASSASYGKIGAGGTSTGKR